MACLARAGPGYRPKAYIRGLGKGTGTDVEMTVADIIKEVFMPRGKELPPETVIMDMPEWDSLTHMSFIMRLETEFNVLFSGDQIAAMRTIADVEKTLAAQLVAGA